MYCESIGHSALGLWLAGAADWLADTLAELICRHDAAISRPLTLVTDWLQSTPTSRRSDNHLLNLKCSVYVTFLQFLLLNSRNFKSRIVIKHCNRFLKNVKTQFLITNKTLNESGWNKARHKPHSVEFNLSAASHLHPFLLEVGKK